ncbi:MAG: hypothetical protein KGQ26_04915 [Rhodospirillales bacterium]|nr:hypothetical protein [Rhodospirillales bacterium]MDE2319101.1 hypothetical protein [Rhodospirillales bacterium]
MDKQMHKFFIAAGLAALLLPLNARADEQFTPLAASGDWAAFVHRDSMADAPDFCGAGDLKDGLIFRADNTDIEIRYSDDSWSLPANVSGNLALAVNGNNYVLPITANTNTQVMAVISQDQLEEMVADMNKAGSMQLTPGSGNPVTISLDGSNIAITAFLTCAGISQPGNTGGENPFQSAPTNSNTQNNQNQ